MSFNPADFVQEIKEYVKERKDKGNLKIESQHQTEMPVMVGADKERLSYLVKSLISNCVHRTINKPGV